MSDSDRPPLDPRAYEQIEVLLHKIDQRHWPWIAAMRVPRFTPLDEPVPPQMPHHFLNQIQWYASMLLKTEADQYEQFRNDEHYPVWLSKLSERILDRILRNLDRIEQAKLDETLLHHGVTKLEIIFAVRGVLQELTHPYTGGIAHLPSQDEAIHSPATVPARTVETAPELFGRTSLFDSYRSAFPDAGIMDICWAAKQHYREWARWLKSQVKDGSKPDRAFRHVLLSGKAPSELRREPRPKGWK